MGVYVCVGVCMMRLYLASISKLEDKLITVGCQEATSTLYTQCAVNISTQTLCYSVSLKYCQRCGYSQSHKLASFIS